MLVSIRLSDIPVRGRSWFRSCQQGFKEKPLQNSDLSEVFDFAWFPLPRRLDQPPQTLVDTNQRGVKLQANENDEGMGRGRSRPAVSLSLAELLMLLMMVLLWLSVGRGIEKLDTYLVLYRFVTGDCNAIRHHRPCQIMGAVEGYALQAAA